MINDLLEPPSRLVTNNVVAATSAAVAVLVGEVIIRLLAVCWDCDDDDDARAERSATIDDANDRRSVHPIDADEFDEVTVSRW